MDTTTDEPKDYPTALKVADELSQFEQEPDWVEEEPGDAWTEGLGEYGTSYMDAMSGNTQKEREAHIEELYARVMRGVKATPPNPEDPNLQTDTLFAEAQAALFGLCQLAGYSASEMPTDEDQ